MVVKFVLKFLVLATTTGIRTATGYYNAAKQVGASTYMIYRKRRKKETIVTLFAFLTFFVFVFVFFVIFICIFVCLFCF